MMESARDFDANDMPDEFGTSNIPIQETPLDSAPVIVTDSEKLEIMRAQLEWLCFHVNGLLSVMQGNPLFRSMMASAQRKATK